MIRLIAATGVCILLAGCGTTKPVTQPIIQTKIFVPDIPRSAFYCNDEVSYPNPDTLTEKDLGDLIVLLDTRLKECGVNADSGLALWTRLKANAEAANAALQ